MQEYCNGGSLRTTIVQGALGPATSGGLERRWLPLMHVAKSIAEGMRYLHSQRILHGDLNPANILLKVSVYFFLVSLFDFSPPGGDIYV